MIQEPNGVMMEATPCPASKFGERQNTQCKRRLIRRSQPAHNVGR